jgi:iron(III) transport system ATP-binding protein
VALLALSGVSKRYAAGSPPAVDDLSLEVEGGSVLALLGPSGCGKTTTLRLIAGFESPDSGRITIAGRLVADGPGTGVQPEHRGVGLVFQDYALFPHLTSGDNVGFGLHGLAKQARRDRVREVLGLVGLSGFEPRYPHELSGGQQQRVAVARALAPAPALLLLDEPFSNLDADLRAQMRDDVVGILRSTGTTAVFVTHDQDEAFTVADVVGVLNHGRLEQIGSPEEIYRRPATPFVAGFVGAADFIPGVVEPAGIATELGVLGSPGALAMGTRVKVMVRPDDVDFRPADAGGAVILRRYFRGAQTLYCLGLASGHRVHSSQPSSPAFAPGTRVRPTATVREIVTFPED